MQTELPGPGSPVLGAGTNGPATDERGHFRPHDGCDLGAVELTATGKPTATITAPVDGASYTAGTTVKAAYTCADPAGPGITSCTGTVPNGHPIDTTKPGKFTFTVTATSADGATATVSSSYTVTPKPPPPAALSISIRTATAVVRHGHLSLHLACSGGAPNSTCTGKVSLTLRRRVVRVVHHHRRFRYVTAVVGSGRYTLRSGHLGAVVVRLTPTGLRLLRSAQGHRLRTLARVTLVAGKPAVRTVVIMRPARR
jgi:hypothetical protein